MAAVQVHVLDECKWTCRMWTSSMHMTVIGM